MEISGDKDMENSMDNGMEKQYKYDAFISYRHVEPAGLDNCEGNPQNDREL